MEQSLKSKESLGLKKGEGRKKVKMKTSRKKWREKEASWQLLRVRRGGGPLAVSPQVPIWKRRLKFVRNVPAFSASRAKRSAWYS